MVLELIIVIDNSSILFFFQSSALSISSYSLFIHLPSIGMGGPDEEDHSGEKGEGGVEDSCIKIIISIFFYENCDNFDDICDGFDNIFVKGLMIFVKVE